MSRREDRYWEKVERRGPDECWPWTASRNTFGYGTFRGDGDQLAHRYGYRLANGDIPKGMHVCHQCDNPPCQNPAHLFLGTHAENHADKAQKGRSRTRPAFGESNPHAKLTESDVRGIRAESVAGVAQSVIAAKYGIGQTQVSRIVRRIRWKEVE